MWKTIEEFPSYEVNQNGEVRNSKTGLIRKLQKTNTGYLQVELIKGNIIRNRRVHRLVALAFLPNPYNKEQVNHINGDKQDNRVENLEWVTQDENIRHSQEIGLSQKAIGVVQYTLEGEYVNEYESLTLAAKVVSGKTCSIHNCCKGTQKQHKNYVWRFKDAN